MDLFSDRVTRLKHELRVSKDQEVAALLRLSKTAFSERKKRNSFPERELVALAKERPELKLDTHYVLTGERVEDVAAAAIKGIPARIRALRKHRSEMEFAADWGVDPEQLAQIESGQRLPSPELLMRLIKMHPEEDAAWILIGVRQAIQGELTAKEVVLVTNYRASSQEGQEALGWQADFFAQYNSAHATAQPKAAKGGQ